MKNCLACGYEEKDNTSLFCSNCGKIFKNEPLARNKEVENESTSVNTNKKKILEIILVPFIVLNLLIGLIMGYSFPLIASLIPTIIVVGLLINEEYGFELENKTKDESVSEATRLIMATRHQ